MKKDIYVGTRIPEELKVAFQEALEKDGRHFTIAQVLRYWIERFVKYGIDQGGPSFDDLIQERDKLERELAVQKRLSEEYRSLLSERLKG